MENLVRQENDSLARGLHYGPDSEAVAMEEVLSVERIEDQFHRDFVGRDRLQATVAHHLDTSFAGPACWLSDVRQEALRDTFANQTAPGRIGHRSDGTVRSKHAAVNQ